MFLISNFGFRGWNSCDFNWILSPRNTELATRRKTINVAITYDPAGKKDWSLVLTWGVINSLVCTMKASNSAFQVHQITAITISIFYLWAVSCFCEILLFCHMIVVKVNKKCVFVSSCMKICEDYKTVHLSQNTGI